jgi:hypothetical protein
VKIVDIRAIPLSYPCDPPYGGAGGMQASRGALLVEVETDDRIIGIGEAGVGGGSTWHVIETQLRPMQLGENPLLIERLWQKMFARTRQFGHPETAPRSGRDALKHLRAMGQRRQRQQRGRSHLPPPARSRGHAGDALIRQGTRPDRPVRSRRPGAPALFDRHQANAARRAIAKKRVADAFDRNPDAVHFAD